MAIVAAYNFDALLPNGKVPDMAGYSRDLTLDAGVALTAGHAGQGLQCTVGGAAITYPIDDYIGNSISFSCFAWVKSLSSSNTPRVIAANHRGNDWRQIFYLTDTNGYLSADIGVVGGTITHASSGVSVLDGAWHHVGVAYDALDTGDITFWVDGDVVATVAKGVPTPSSGDGTWYIGRSTSAATQTAQAVIDDLRWFNDPVYPTEGGYFTGPVLNLAVAAYAFDEVGGTVMDATLRDNDLTLTAEGSRAAAVNGNGLFSTGDHGAEATVDLWDSGAFDRLTVCGWARITTAGSAAAFLSLEDSGGTPKFQLFRGGGNAMLFKAWSISGAAPFNGDYRFGADGALSTSEWRFFFVNLNPTGYEARVYSAAGTVLDTFSALTGNPPTNAPIISGISQLRLGGGVVALDDVRIIRNYLNGTAVLDLLDTPVAPEPAGVLSDVAVGDLSIAGLSLGDVEVSGVALGDTLVFGV
jgi:hypothetical protein